MGDGAPRVLAVVLTAVAVMVSGCGTTSKPRIAAPLPTSLVVLGTAKPAAGADWEQGGFCSGVLIGKAKVLTAARCLRKRKASSLVARAVDREGCRVVTGRRARGATNVSVGAASVVRLRRGLPPSAAEPIPVGDMPGAGDVVVAWGWGPGRPGVGCIPRPVRLEVLPTDECSELVGDDGVAVYFCAVPEADQNTCPGDSGGPVVDQEGRLVGITLGGKACGTRAAARYWSTANVVERAG